MDAYGPTVVDSCIEQDVNTAPVTFLTYTPDAPGNFVVEVYFRVDHLTGGGNTGSVHPTLTYTDGYGAKTVNGGVGYTCSSDNNTPSLVDNTEAFSMSNVGASYVFRWFLNSVSGQPISFSAYNAANNGTVKVSGCITRV